MAGYLGSVPVPQATQHRETFTCTEGQTTFNTAGYTPQFVDVYLNGSHLSPADFTASNSSDVVLAVAASADDVCDIVSYTPFEVASQTFTGTTTMTDVVAASLDISGNIDIDGTTNLDVVDIDGAVNMATTALVTGVLTTTAATVFNGGFASNAPSTITSNTPVLTFTESDQSDKQYQIGSFGAAFAINDASASSFRYVIDTNGNHAFNDGTATFAGVVTANAGVVVDNFTLDGTTLALSSGAFTLDVAGDINLDAGGGNIILLDDGTHLGTILLSSSALRFDSQVSNQDITFTGNDGGAGITALKLDMSDAGTAIFNSRVAIANGTASVPSFTFSGDTNTGMFRGSADNLAFTTGGTERVIIKNNGDLLVAKNVQNSTAVGAQLNATGETFFTANAAQCCQVNRLSDDGVLITLQQANATIGTISSSGATVSYNAFSGSHWSRLTDNSQPTILKGTLIETIDEMCDWYQAVFTVPATTRVNEKGETVEDIAAQTMQESIALPDSASVGDTISHTYSGVTCSATIVKEDDNKHTKCKISDTADSTRIYGVFSAWDNDDDTVNDMYVTAVGTHLVRVHGDQTVSAGDLLVSNGDGTAKVQDDDIIRSKTLGKVLTNIKQETYADNSYTVPCALYCG